MGLSWQRKKVERETLPTFHLSYYIYELETEIISEVCQAAHFLVFAFSALGHNRSHNHNLA